MNKSHVLDHLREAQDQLAQLIAELESDPDYEPGSFLVDMSHLYHHVNTAWNGQDASAERVAECSEEDFKSWRSMPHSEDLLLVG